MQQSPPLREFQENVAPADFTLLVVDGECALCSWGARTIARGDVADQFRILPAQTARGRALFAQHCLDPDDPASWLALQPDGTALTDSAAVVAVGRRLAGPWSWIAFCAGLVPRVFRDPAYRLIARNRYRLFGRGDLCATPSPELRRRLLTE